MRTRTFNSDNPSLRLIEQEMDDCQSIIISELTSILMYSLVPESSIKTLKTMQNTKYGRKIYYGY
jgi:hypothetical protein